MKTCHMCKADFPSGLTCPECGAFVVDLPVSDSPGIDRAALEPTATPAPGSLGGWVTNDAHRDGDDSAEPEGPSRALAEPEPGSLGGWVTPSKAIESETPKPQSHSTSRSESPPTAPDPAAPDRSAPDRSAPNRSAPNRSAPDRAAPDPTAKATPPSSASQSPTGRPELKPAGFSPKVIAMAVAATALLALIVLGAFLVRSQNSAGTSAGGPAGASTDLTGTCIRYNADRSMMERTVPCSEPHSGQVVAYVTEQASCPPTTDSILTGKADLAGTSGVLCIDEQA